MTLMVVFAIGDLSFASSPLALAVLFLYILGKKRWSCGMVGYIQQILRLTLTREGTCSMRACGTCVHVVLSCYVSKYRDCNISSRSIAFCLPSFLYLSNIRKLVVFQFPTTITALPAQLEKLVSI